MNIFRLGIQTHEKIFSIKDVMERLKSHFVWNLFELESIGIKIERNESEARVSEGM